MQPMTAVEPSRRATIRARRCALVRFFARQAYLLQFTEEDFKGLSRSMSSIPPLPR